jgi:hypothetical protein
MVRPARYQKGVLSRIIARLLTIPLSILSGFPIGTLSVSTRTLSRLCAVDDHRALAAGRARRAEAGASPPAVGDAVCCGSIPRQATRNARASSAT